MRIADSLALPNSATTRTSALRSQGYTSASFVVTTTGALTIGFEGSADGTTWGPLHNADGTLISLAAAPAGTRALVVELAGLPQVRVSFANASGGALAATVDAFVAGRAG